MINVKKREDKTSNFLLKKESWERKSVFLIGIMAFALLIGIILISALTTEEQNALQSELNSLEGNLTESGYEWPVNYSILFGRLNKSIYIHNIMYLDTYS